MRSLIIGAALAAASLTASAQAYTIVTPSCTVNTNGWCLGGSNMTNFLAAITNSAYFGTGGIVSTGITVVQVDTFDAGTLAGADAILVPWWFDGEVDAATINTITSFFTSGGDLMLMDDDSAHDPIGEALGVPTGASNGSVSNGTSPLFVGPFGAASNVSQNGNTGQFDPAALAAVNGSVGGTNGAGEITSAFWDDGDYAAGAGRMVLLGDVDMVSNFSGADYGAINGQAKFALNSVAYLVNGATRAVPEPATWGLMIAGFGAMGLALRRRQTAVVSFA